MVLNNKTGFIIEPKNSRAIADSVIRFYEEDLEENFSLNAGEEKKNYSWETFTDAIKNLVKH